MEKNTTKTEVREKIQELLKTLKAEQEKKPLRLVEPDATSSCCQEWTED